MLAPRQLFLAVALALTVAAAVFGARWQQADESDSAADGAANAGGSAAVARGARAPQAGARSSVVAAHAGTAAALAAQDGASAPLRMLAAHSDLFASHDWTPPPARRTLVVEQPHAPPLPFVYQGKLMQDGAVTAFVAQGPNNLALKTGDKAGSYRVDSVTPSAMTLVYVPLNEKQILSFGSAN